MNRTKIRPLGKLVSTAANSDTDFVYQPDTGVTEKHFSDPALLKQLTDDIHALDKESHKQIYLLLRKHKDISFFTQESTMLIFNRDMLSQDVLVELHNLVHMCKENQARRTVIGVHEKQYADNLPKSVSLAVTIEDNQTPISEGQKLQNMLLLNQ